MKHHVLNSWKKWPLLLAVALFFCAYTIHKPAVKQTNSVVSVPMDNVRALFPKAHHVESISEKTFDYAVFDASSNRIGEVALSKPFSDKLRGYTAQVHFAIGIKDDKVVGISLLPNEETPGFIDMIKEAGFFDSWNGLSVAQAASKQVDAVSGATFTTTAVKKAMQSKCEAIAAIAAAEAHERTDPLRIALDAALYLFLAFSLLAFLSKRVARHRVPLLIASVVVMGFACGISISMFMIKGWMVNGLDVVATPAMAILLVLSVALPLFTNKNYYCQYACPYGALQALAEKINRSHVKLHIPHKIAHNLRHCRDVYFLFFLLIALLGTTWDLSRFEPFTAFLVKSASLSALIIGGAFFALSFFLTRPWCNYFCPTGYFLELARKPFHAKKKAKGHVEVPEKKQAAAARVADESAAG